MAAFDPRRFGEVLKLPGAAKFSAAGFLTRVPLAGAGLGITFAVVHQTGSYSVAGLLVAFFALTRALSAPILSRIVDRHGQFRVMLPATMYQLIMLAILTAGIYLEWHFAAQAVLATLAGFGSGSPPAYVRARWSNTVQNPQQLSTAFAWESLIESTAFSLTPLAIVGIIGFTEPISGMIFVVAMVGISGTLLYTQRKTEPPVVRETDGRRQKVGRHAALMVILSGSYYFCVSFAAGALDIISVAQGEVVAIAGFTGIVLAVGSIGKMVGAITYGSVQWKWTPQQRMYGLVPCFIGATLLLPLIGDGPWLILAAFALGPFYSAILTSANLGVQGSVPRGRLTEMLAWMFASMGAGIAAGNFLTGVAIDAGGFAAASWVYVASSALMLLTLIIDVAFMRKPAKPEETKVESAASSSAE